MRGLRPLVAAAGVQATAHSPRVGDPRVSTQRRQAPRGGGVGDSDVSISPFGEAKRSRVGSPRPSPAPRGSETRVCPNGGRHRGEGGGVGDSGVRISPFGEAERSRVGSSRPPPLPAGRRPACVPTAAGKAAGRSRRLRCQNIPIRRSEAEPSGVTRRPSPAPRGSETRVCPSGGRHRVVAESETPMSEYPHSA